MPKPKRIRLTDSQVEKYKEYSKMVLNLATVGAIITVAIMAPNAVKMFSPLMKKKWWKSDEEAEGEIERFNQKLIKERYLKSTKKKGKDYLVITEKGKKRVIGFNIDTIKIKSQDWDGRWRIVIFDIPEKYKAARNILREKLREIGFLLVQKSVWICPYECEDEISFIARTYMIDRYVNYIRADSIDIESSLKEYFDL